MRRKALLAILMVPVFLLGASASELVAGTAQLSWDPNTEPELAGYRIYCGAAPRTGTCPQGGYPNQIDVGNVTTYTLNNLAEGQTYYFSATAYDRSGNESCFSNEVSKTFPSNAGTMPIPAGPTAVACQVAPGSFTLDPNPQLARPLSVPISGGWVTVQMGFVGFTASVDIYAAVQLPDMRIFIVNSFGQWLPYPAYIVPWRASSAQGVSGTLWQGAVNSLPTGLYAAWVVVVPAGTNPITFDWATSPYYLWCFNKNF